MSGALVRRLTAVAIAGRAVLIDGAPGSGKSSLAFALIDRGAILIGDDGVALAAADGRLLVSPAPTIRGLLEIRNVGLVRMPFAIGIPAALLLRLAEDAPRYVEAPACETIGGVALPMLALWPASPVLALRAEAALRRHGLAVVPE